MSCVAASESPSCHRFSKVVMVRASLIGQSSCRVLIHRKIHRLLWFYHLDNNDLRRSYLVDGRLDYGSIFRTSPVPIDIINTIEIIPIFRI
jgi:hypothetical protein